MKNKCSCPKDSTFANFLDGNLDQINRNRFIKHISNCSDCLDPLFDFLKFLPDQFDEIKAKTRLNFQ